MSLNLVSRSLDTLSCAFTGIFSTGNSEGRSCKVTSAVRLPFRLLAAFGLLISNAGAANVFTHSDSTIGLDSILPKLLVTKTPEGMKCADKLKETMKEMVQCTSFKVLTLALKREGMSFHCVSEDLGRFAVFDPKQSIYAISADKEFTQLPKNEYARHILRDFTDWMWLKEIIKLDENKCKESDLRYANSRYLIFDKSDKLLNEILDRCVASGHWPKEFLPHISSARKLVAEYISEGEFENFLTSLKSEFQKAGIKGFENASHEELIEIVVEHIAEKIKKETEEQLPAARIKASIEDWEENCRPNL